MEELEERLKDSDIETTIPRKKKEKIKIWIKPTTAKRSFI
jgi:hypothetical protein